MITAFFILCLYCLLPCMIFMFFMFIARCRFARGTKWLFVLWKMWTGESLLSNGHILHNTISRRLAKRYRGFCWLLSKKKKELPIIYIMILSYILL